MAEGRHLYIDNKTRETLIKRASDGDLDAFEALCGVYVNAVYRFVFVRIRHHQNTEDIVQEVFFKVWKGIRGYNGDKESTFRGWLLRIARNTMIDSIRRTRRDNSHLSSVDVADIQVAEPDSQLNELLGMLEMLSPEQREAILLKLVEDLDNKEIAQVMRKREGAVRMLHMRGLAKLREHMKNLENGRQER